ncbi:uncharacterized protein K444DRAFT_340625 [Hyaloscypha bicolor E]|uniref:Uncharacterized protein n=1 Tax=Hyaloscypha bicolor E TaxID=1095630 RepID=A0A2J6TH68_9HELO|nr:uncharacterized protein K444DRAFT_340625 [Hyaloscypha bicolor E]PMD62375.1 hypothetical protein K444DRAFT_340625 [Hyaloscypha bicolor E]
MAHLTMTHMYLNKEILENRFDSSVVERKIAVTAIIFRPRVRPTLGAVFSFFLMPLAFFSEENFHYFPCKF